MRSWNDLDKIRMEKHWRFNPDKKIVDMILDKENKDFELLHNYYCPCKKQKTKENICPCNNAQNEINQNGHCHCMLYADSNPITIELSYKRGHLRVFETFSGNEEVQVFFYKDKDETKHICISERKRGINLIKTNNQWYLSDGIVLLPHYKQQAIEISDIVISVSLGLMEKGFAKRVTELFQEYYFGSE